MEILLETVNVVITLVQNVGLPGFLLIGGGWFFAKHVWPDFVRLAAMYAESMSSIAHALALLAAKLPEVEPWRIEDK